MPKLSLSLSICIYKTSKGYFFELQIVFSQVVLIWFKSHNIIGYTCYVIIDPICKILFYTGLCYNNFSYIFIFSQMWQPFSWESKLNTSQVPFSPWKMPRSPWKLQKIHGVGRCCIGCPESEKSSLWHWKNHGSDNDRRYIGYHI